jgi:hypothetical protein
LIGEVPAVTSTVATKPPVHELSETVTEQPVAGFGGVVGGADVAGGSSAAEWSGRPVAWSAGRRPARPESCGADSKIFSEWAGGSIAA